MIILMVADRNAPNVVVLLTLLLTQCMDFIQKELKLNLLGQMRKYLI